MSLSALGKLIEQVTKAKDGDAEAMNYFRNSQTTWNVDHAKQLITGLHMMDVRSGAKGGATGGLSPEAYMWCKEQGIITDDPGNQNCVQIDCKKARESSYAFIQKKAGQEQLANWFDKVLNTVFNSALSSQSPMQLHTAIRGGQ